MNDFTSRAGAVLLACLALSVVAAPASAADIHIGGFAGFFGQYNASTNKVDFNLDEAKIIPVVSFGEDLALFSEFVYDFHRTANVINKGSDIPFKMERLYLSILNVTPWVNLELGQMRIPFGFWDDLSASRHIARIKNSNSVMGFKLRKRDVGVSAFGDLLPDGLLSYHCGVFNGNGENTPGDDDQTKDLVGRLSTRLGPLDLGISSYYGAPFSSIAKYSLGLDYQIQLTNELLLSGEAAYVANNSIKGAAYTSGSATGGYVQACYNLYGVLPGFRLFAMLDAYQETLSTASALDTQYLGGFRYRFAPGATTVMNVVYGTAKDDTSVILKVELSY